MTYNEVILKGKKVEYYELRNECGMYIGSAISNASPFKGCAAVTIEDAERNARLWAASDKLLEALHLMMSVYPAGGGGTAEDRNYAVLKAKEAIYLAHRTTKAEEV